MSLMKIVQSSQADSFDFSPLQTRSSTIEKTADGEALIETPLSAEQERPLRPRGPTIRVPKAVHVPDFVVGLLSFYVLRILAETDLVSCLFGKILSCLSSLGEVYTDVLNKTNAAAIWYLSVAKKTRPDLHFSALNFSILSNTDYYEKLDTVTSGPQFTEVKSTDRIMLKTEKKFN